MIPSSGTKPSKIEPDQKHLGIVRLGRQEATTAPPGKKESLLRLSPFTSGISALQIEQSDLENL